ncbi:hypothetical protein [Lentzea sp. NPDC092896]
MSDAVGADQGDPGREHVQQFDAPLLEEVQRVRDVELGDQRVGQRDERA